MNANMVQLYSPKYNRWEIARNEITMEESEDKYHNCCNTWTAAQIDCLVLNAPEELQDAWPEFNYNNPIKTACYCYFANFCCP